MPDGTKAASKHNDGQLWSKWDSTGNEVEKWQWEGTRDCWVNISSGKPTKANTATFAITPMDLDNYTYDLDGPIQPIKVFDPKCECGSLKVGSPRHSSWCQMYSSAQ